MIIDFIYGQGGGSGSGVTPEEVQEQIQSALTEYTPTSGFSTINGSAITEGEAIVIDEPDLSGYWTSAQTQSALDAKQDVIDDLDSIRSGAQAGSTAVQPAALADYVDNTELQSTLAGYYTSAQTDNLISNFVSSADVKTQIDSALTSYTPTSGFATINGSAITNGDNLVIDADLSGYWNSAETQTAINTATSGLATSAQVYTVEYTVSVALNELHTEMSAITAASENFVTSAQVETQITGKGYITDDALTAYTPTSGFSTVNGSAITDGGNITIQTGGIYTAGSNIDISNDVISVTGITIPTSNTAFTNDAGYITSADTQNFVTSGQVETQITNKGYATSANVNTALASYTPTSGFSTINGSAITNGGNIVIEGGGDLSNYWDSAQTQAHIDSAYTSATTHIEDVERVTASALNELHNEVAVISGASENYITSAYVNTALASYTPTSGFSTINGSAITAGGNLVIEGGGDLSAYWTSAQTQTAITTATANMVSSTTVTNIWRGTQADYDLIDPKDPNALYIILAS